MGTLLFCCINTHLQTQSAGFKWKLSKCAGIEFKIMKTVQKKKKKKVITAKQNRSEQKECSRFSEKHGEMHQNLKL